jgi:serine protease
MSNCWRMGSVAGVIVLILSSISSAFAQDANADQRVFIPFVYNLPGSTTEAVADQPSMTDQIIVRFTADVQAAAADRAAQVTALSQAAGVDLAYEREMSGDATVLKLPGRLNPEEVRAILDRLAALEQIELAEPDLIMQPMVDPNDTEYTKQWHYSAPVAGSYGANLPAAWTITTGSSTQVVAVIDTGITNHTEFAGRTVPGYDFIANSGVANDGNGRDADPSDPGDWITTAESASGSFAGCQVRNSSWHGTHVAGTIGANSNNGAGVAGINWQDRILPVRVLGKCGGYTSDIADGIRWSAGGSVLGVPANANPAKVINLSLGGAGACTSTYQNAINEAVNRGVVVVVAAGNNNADAANYAPANCSNVITVAATGSTGSRAYYSNYGGTVEIAAPGGDVRTGTAVYSTVNAGSTVPAADGYAFYQGTSMATPHVAGIVSLMLAVKANLTPAQVTNLLQSTITPFPSGSTCTPTTCGPGIVNAASAVHAAQAFSPPAPGVFNKTAPANGQTGLWASSVTLQWSASSNVSQYQYCIDTSNNNSCDNDRWLSVGPSTSVRLGSLAARTTYYWQVRAVNPTETYANGGTWWNFKTR